MTGSRLRALLVAGMMWLAAGPSAAAAPSPSPETQPTPARCHLTWPLPALVTPLSWMDHHYPTRDMDGMMVRYDGNSEANYDGHRGLDLPVPQGTPVLAAADGLVTYASWDDAGGNGVGILHDRCRTFYFHARALLVSIGQRVRRGEVIAYSGTTGNSTGPHVHFEVRDLGRRLRAVDPYGWTGQGADPWVFDQGVLWLGLRPSSVPPIVPEAVPYRPVQDVTAGGDASRTVGSLTSAGYGRVTLRSDGELRFGAGAVRLPVQDGALAMRACGRSICILDGRGQLIDYGTDAVRVVFTLPMSRRAAAFDCFQSEPVACVVIDNWGEPYGASAAEAAPDVSALPGVWPLRGAPAVITLDPGATPGSPAGLLEDGEGGSVRFGKPLLRGVLAGLNEVLGAGAP